MPGESRPVEKPPTEPIVTIAEVTTATEKKSGKKQKEFPIKRPAEIKFVEGHDAWVKDVRATKENKEDWFHGPNGPAPPLEDSKTDVKEQPVVAAKQEPVAEESIIEVKEAVPDPTDQALVKRAVGSIPVAQVMEVSESLTVTGDQRSVARKAAQEQELTPLTPAQAEHKKFSAYTKKTYRMAKNAVDFLSEIGSKPTIEFVHSSQLGRHASAEEDSQGEVLTNGWLLDLPGTEVPGSTITFLDRSGVLAHAHLDEAPDAEYTDKVTINQFHPTLPKQRVMDESPVVVFEPGNDYPEYLLDELGSEDEQRQTEAFEKIPEQGYLHSLYQTKIDTMVRSARSQLPPQPDETQLFQQQPQPPQQ